MNANIFQSTNNERIDRFKSIIFLQKIGYSRSCAVSVYFNNRQSLEPNEIETGTVLLSLSVSLSATPLMRISNMFSSPGLFLSCIHTVLCSLHLSLINNYMNSTVGEARERESEREKRRGTYCEELRAPPPYFFLLPIEKSNSM